MVRKEVSVVSFRGLGSEGGGYKGAKFLRWKFVADKETAELIDGVRITPNFQNGGSNAVGGSGG